MSHYARSEDNTISYQYIHSTPPKRPSAGVSRCDPPTLPPPLSRTNTDFSTSPLTIPISSTRRGLDSKMSSLWPWNDPNVDFDDREKMALVTDERRVLPKVSMRPWEGWRVVFLGSCRIVTIPAKCRLLIITRAQHTASLPPCFREYLGNQTWLFKNSFTVDCRIPIGGIILARLRMCASSSSIFSRPTDVLASHSLRPLHDTTCQGKGLYAPCSTVDYRLICTIEQLHDRAVRELAIRLGGSKAALLNASLVRFPLLNMMLID